MVQQLWAKSRKNLCSSKGRRTSETPSKRARETTIASFGDFGKRLGLGGDEVNFVPHLRLLPVIEGEGSDLSPSNWIEGGLPSDSNNLSVVVSRVESSLVSLGEALGVLAQDSQNRFLEVDHEAKLIASAMHSLGSSIGTGLELDRPVRGSHFVGINIIHY
jgi:hypothetical protein